MLTQKYSDSSISNFFALSSDTKPTDCPNGSRLLEIDTGNLYVFNAENKTWILWKMSVDVDVEMSTTSMNPVANKTITNAVNLKLNIADAVGEKMNGKEQSWSEGPTTTVTDYGKIGSERFNNYSSNIAIGMYSHAEGNGTKAIGNYSHAEGNNTKAEGIYSHTEGNGTNAVGTCGHAEGYLSTASGYNTHAEGQSTTASALAAHAEGEGTSATAPHTHTEGYATRATAESAHAEGSNTTASGEYSHSQGFFTIAASNYQTAMGRLNAEDSSDKYAMIIGNGEDTNNRSNAFAIDWDGKIYVGNTQTGVDVSALASSISTKQDQLTFDSAPTSGSTNPVISGGIYSTLLPITQAEYDAIETKTLPIYFVYETDAQTLMQSSFPNAVNDITVVPSTASLMSSVNPSNANAVDNDTDSTDEVTEPAFTFKTDVEPADLSGTETSSSFDFFSEEES